MCLFCCEPHLLRNELISLGFFFLLAFGACSHFGQFAFQFGCFIFFASGSLHLKTFAWLYLSNKISGHWFTARGIFCCVNIANYTHIYFIVSCESLLQPGLFDGNSWYFSLSFAIPFCGAFLFSHIVKYWDSFLALRRANKTYLMLKYYCLKCSQRRMHAIHGIYEK